MKKALFDAILASPEDDAPRLVYADWLTENGVPARGELIIIQCRRARGDAGDGIADQEAALLVRHGKRWLAEVGLKKGGTFERGFVERVEIGHKELVAAAPKLAEASVLRAVTLSHVTPRGRFSQIAVMDRVRSLRLVGTYLNHLNTQDMALIDLPRLTALDLQANPVQDRGVHAVMQLPALRELRLASFSVRLAIPLPSAPQLGARALAEVEWPELDLIELYGCEPKGARKLLMKRFGDRLHGAR